MGSYIFCGNDDGLKNMEARKTFALRIRKRQFLGRIMRKWSLESVMFTGYIEDKKDRGRQRVCT